MFALLQSCEVDGSGDDDEGGMCVGDGECGTEPVANCDGFSEGVYTREPIPVPHTARLATRSYAAHAARRALQSANASNVTGAGCTDSFASNFVASATYDDGSCQRVGCTDPIALSYNSQANVLDAAACTYVDELDPPVW